MAGYRITFPKSIKEHNLNKILNKFCFVDPIIYPNNIQLLHFEGNEYKICKTSKSITILNYKKNTRLENKLDKHFSFAKQERI